MNFLAGVSTRASSTRSSSETEPNVMAANTCVSPDELVKAPLGLLWFGGPSNEAVLPRHGHGPPEQVIGGRLFIEGPDMIRAVDVYTGRLLWEVRLEDVGKNYDYTSHEPGANALGTKLIVLWLANCGSRNSIGSTSQYGTRPTRVVIPAKAHSSTHLA